MDRADIQVLDVMAQAVSLFDQEWVNGASYSLDV